MMTPCRANRGVLRVGQAGSVLIIVLWVAFGLISLTLYFANSMSLELRAADNRVAAIEAEQAVLGAARYVTNILSNLQYPGTLPDTNNYQLAAVPIGNAHFWLIGRDDSQNMPMLPRFGLVDEASKLNLNTVTGDMLAALPRMTADLASSILTWRSSSSNRTSSTSTALGAQSDTYMRLNPPYRCKNAKFESVDELRLVYGAYLDILYGEDANLNGVLDLNENDANLTPPLDNRDGRLDPGILEYVTVYTHEPTTTIDGTNRVNVGLAAQQLQRGLQPLLAAKLGADRSRQILGNLGLLGGGGAGGGRGAQAGGGGNTTPFTSTLQLYIRSLMTADEFAQIEDYLRNPSTDGLVNVNTASATVLACLLNAAGGDTNQAPALITHRQSLPRPLKSVAWVKDVLDQQTAVRLGRYITGRTYQYNADIAAVGHYGRGYQRVRYIVDTSEGTAKILYRQDLTHTGWALGKQTRDVLLLAKQIH